MGDTAALVSGSPSDDSQYTGFVGSLATLGAQRDTLASAIKAGLDSAAFGSGLSADADSELESSATR